MCPTPLVYDGPIHATRGLTVVQKSFQVDKNIGEGCQLLFVFEKLGQVVCDALSIVVHQGLAKDRRGPVLFWCGSQDEAGMRSFGWQDRQDDVWSWRWTAGSERVCTVDLQFAFPGFRESKALFVLDGQPGRCERINRFFFRRHTTATTLGRGELYRKNKLRFSPESLKRWAK